MARATPAPRARFRFFTGLRPRWAEIDVFGHVNNAAFYTWFDSAVVDFLHRAHVMGAKGDGPALLVVESRAQFHAEVLFTDDVEVGVSVEHLGTSSVRYGFGVFTNGGTNAAVDGGFTHVMADRASRRPIPIPQAARDAFNAISIEQVTT